MNIFNLFKRKRKYQFVVKKVGEVDPTGSIYTEEILKKMAKRNSSLKYENGRLLETISL
jgi:hypothetical protein